MSQGRILRWLRRTLVGVALLCLLSARVVQAAADELAIRAPSVSVVNGVYVLNARLQFDVPEQVEQQLRDGATLTMELRVRFSRSRNWWRDVQLANLEQRYELLYHSVSERYVLRNLNSGEQRAFVTLTEALVSMQRIENVPLLDENLITPDERNEISLQAHLEVQSIPGVLSVLLFWHSEFALESIWYTWPMTWPMTWSQNSNSGSNKH